MSSHEEVTILIPDIATAYWKRLAAVTSTKRKHAERLDAVDEDSDGSAKRRKFAHTQQGNHQSRQKVRMPLTSSLLNALVVPLVQLPLASQCSRKVGAQKYIRIPKPQNSKNMESNNALRLERGEQPCTKQALKVSNLFKLQGS
jgi:hypothetical protein